MVRYLSFLVFIIVQLGYSVLPIKIVPLVSKKLCNNAVDDHSPICYDQLYKKEFKCDDRIITQESCREAIVTGALSVEMLQQIGSIVDHDSSIRKLRLSTHSSKTEGISAVGDLVDDFLLPRPMWSVVQEPINANDSFVYVMERYSQLWDAYFERVVAMQFPTREICSTTTMLVGHANCVHPGYSDVRKGYFNTMKQRPRRMGVFVPEHIDAVLHRPHSAFISDSDCPADHLNKWTCAFMQMTNCTLPLAATQKNASGLVVYNATSDGGGALPSTPIEFVPRTAEMNAIAALMKVMPRYRYISPHIRRDQLLRFHGPNEDQVAEFLFMDFLFRKTAFYRRQVAQILKDFKVKYELGDTIRSKERRFVAVHVRRSDRILKRVNMTDYCLHLLEQKFTGIPQNCTGADGVVRPCHGNENVFGCNKFGDVPFGAITLDSVVEIAEQLVGPEVRHMVVLSEDLGWVQREIERVGPLKPQWRFYSLDPPKVLKAEDTVINKDGKVLFSARNGGTEAGAHFQATIALVQECEALLGHFNSGVPMTLAGAMCHHHAGMEGICPPVYDLKQKLS